MNLLLKILFDEEGGTLAITRKTANTLITAAGFNTNYGEIEAVVNGDIDATNLEDDAVTAAKLNSDVVRANYGLLQHTDGTLYVDVYGVMVNAGTNGVEWGRAGDMLLSSSTTTPDGFTDVSTTYADKFIRISATALSTGGANTHTHTATTDSHTLTADEMPAHTHTVGGSQSTGPGGNLDIGAYALSLTHTSSSAGGGGGHTHTVTTAAGDNIPAYLTLKMYQKS